MPSRIPFLLVAAAFLAGAASAATDDLFPARVAPLLHDRCVSCHNPVKRSGGLDLSTRNGLRAGCKNGPVIVAGHADKSLLVAVVDAPRPRMPKAGAKLSSDEVDVLRHWVDAGADWPDGVVIAVPKPSAAGVWWSLKPLTRPAVPRPENAGGIRTPVDAFIRVELEAKGLCQSPEADRVTLLRRVTFDLLGLPPTPEEIDAFVNDTAPCAWERVVERLLASPHYGERWGRHWLDVAHYGDTHGYDKDKRRDNAWPYRDYVVGAFNSDKPYEQLVKEQLAGDVLFPANPDAVAATGFVVAGPWDFVGHTEVREGTVEKERTRSLDRDDMVTNAATTFLSLTVGCARCHDHKFDPVPQADYYRLQAVFAGIERGERPWPRDAARKAALDAEAAKLAKRRSEMVAHGASPSTPELVWLDREIGKTRALLDFRRPPPPATLSPTDGYQSAVSRTNDAVKWVQVDLGKPVRLDEVRLTPARPFDSTDAPGYGFPIRFRVEASGEADFRTARTVADCTGSDYPNPADEPVRFPVGGDPVRYLRVTATRLWGREQHYVFALAELEADAAGNNLAAGAKVNALDSVETGGWSTRYLVDGYSSRGKLPDLSDKKLSAAFHERLALREHLLELEEYRRRKIESLPGGDARAELARLDERIAAVAAELKSFATPRKVYAPVAGKPWPIRVLHRGDVEQPREPASPGALACVSELSADFRLPKPDDEGSRRAALAAWIVDPRNPLTWRSAVNRVWHYHFGRGIVETPGDFGRNGSLPTHPELLDWLACEFRDGGGSFKKLHRLILTSAVYRQASADNAEAAKVDADNRFLWRFNRTRLDSEEVRDAVLAVSGTLDRTPGGPGFELFHFKDDHSPVYDHSAIEKINDPATFRRTVYRFTVRSVPNPMLEALDCPDPSINTHVRNSTLTALQALALLNDPFLLRQSEYFAARVARAGDVPAQVEAAYRLALGRRPTADEQSALAAYASAHGMANACRLLFNLNEFVFID